MPIAFVEERFNTEIRYGLVGGPEFSTTIVETASGVEEININWSESLARWVTAQDLYNRAEVDYLITFFRACQGRAIGFRFKAWEDYIVGPGQGIFKAVPGGFQAYKRYTSVGGTGFLSLNQSPTIIDRRISKVVPIGSDMPTVVYDASGNPVDYAGLTVDWRYGVFSGAGMSANCTWKGEFDNAVRFDTDKIEVEFAGYRETSYSIKGEALFQITGLAIREIRYPSIYEVSSGPVNPAPTMTIRQALNSFQWRGYGLDGASAAGMLALMIQYGWTSAQVDAELQMPVGWTDSILVQYGLIAPVTSGVSPIRAALNSFTWRGAGLDGASAAGFRELMITNGWTCAQVDAELQVYSGYTAAMFAQYNLALPDGSPASTAYQADAPYAPGAVVSYNGNIYVCQVPTVGGTPSGTTANSTYWVYTGAISA